MLKTAIKRVVVLNCLFLLIALFSFFMGVVDLHGRYLDQKGMIAILDAKVMRLCDEHNRSLESLMGYERMAYKNLALATHLPQFDQIFEAVYRIAPRYGFNPELVLKIIQIESGFKPRAVSSKGALGLMQVNLAVWQQEMKIDTEKVFDVDYNIDLGLRILKQYYEGAEGDIKLALHHYNNGYLYNNRAYVKQFPQQLLDRHLPDQVSLIQALDP
jgi:membrane-bound lytic murein transglycosylase MltF